jgi:hypothetical protein
VLTLNTGLVTQAFTAGLKCADVVEPIYSNEASWLQSTKVDAAQEDRVVFEGASGKQ